jgi:hypothetical protein
VGTLLSVIGRPAGSAGASSAGMPAIASELDALLDAALQRVRPLDLTDELGRLVEHQVLGDVQKPLKRLPRRSHVSEHK